MFIIKCFLKIHCERDEKHDIKDELFYLEFQQNLKFSLVESWRWKHDILNKGSTAILLLIALIFFVHIFVKPFARACSFTHNINLKYFYILKNKTGLLDPRIRIQVFFRDPDPDSSIFMDSNPTQIRWVQKIQDAYPQKWIQVQDPLPSLVPRLRQSLQKVVQVKPRHE